ncbi:Homeobox protein Meis2 [Branchiostoma belcheri]|nr:Homeobox protein Meis2 [Branchiostoma belcheri]
MPGDMRGSPMSIPGTTMPSGVPTYSGAQMSQPQYSQPMLLPGHPHAPMMFSHPNSVSGPGPGAHHPHPHHPPRHAPVQPESPSHDPRHHDVTVLSQPHVTVAQVTCRCTVH